MKSPKQHFNSWQQKRQDKRALREAFAFLSDAIDRKDFAAVDKAVAANTRFDYHQVNALLWKAIKKDNLAIFHRVLNGLAGGNMNRKLREYQSGGVGTGISFETEESLLTAAIQSGSDFIALALAYSPGVDIGPQSFSKRWMSRAGESCRVAFAEAANDMAQSPLELARAKGMDCVTAALARRVAELHRQQAERLENEARALGGPL